MRGIRVIWLGAAFMVVLGDGDLRSPENEILGVVVRWPCSGGQS